MTKEHLQLADIVERILAAPPRPAQAIIEARRAGMEPAPPPSTGAEPAPRGRHWADARPHRRPPLASP